MHGTVLLVLGSMGVVAFDIAHWQVAGPRCRTAPKLWRTLEGGY